MPSDFNIVGVKIYRDGELSEGGISIASGKILKIGKESALPAAGQVVQGNGLIALPGLVDVHVHLRDLELSYKEDYLSGTSAAAAGGFTTIVDMPNTRPVTDSAERLKEKISIAQQKIIVNVGFNVVPSSLEEVDKAKDLAIGYKINMVKPWSSLPIDDSSLTSLIERAEAIGKMVIFHAEEGAIVSELEDKYRDSDSLSSYYKAHPSKAEDRAVGRVIGCAKNRKTKIHFCHISSTGSLRKIRAAKRQGRLMTCEATPHHMFLSQRSSSRFGGVSIMDPPLRSLEVAARLFSALKRGWIDILATDHAPHAVKEKRQLPWWKIPIGIPGLETALPLMLTEVVRGSISLRRVVEAMAEAPARIFNLNCGALKEGSAADIVLVDMKRKFKIDSSSFFSKAKYSPFDGRGVTGKVVKTFVGGKLVFDENRVVGEPGTGKIVLPG
jgi:dihydroorotase